MRKLCLGRNDFLLMTAQTSMTVKSTFPKGKYCVVGRKKGCCRSLIHSLQHKLHHRKDMPQTEWICCYLECPIFSWAIRKAHVCHSNSSSEPCYGKTDSSSQTHRPILLTAAFSPLLWTKQKRSLLIIRHQSEKFFGTLFPSPSWTLWATCSDMTIRERVANTHVPTHSWAPSIAPKKAPPRKNTVFLWALQVLWTAVSEVICAAFASTYLCRST